MEDRTYGQTDTFGIPGPGPTGCPLMVLRSTAEKNLHKNLHIDKVEKFRVGAAINTSGSALAIVRVGS